VNAPTPIASKGAGRKRLLFRRGAWVLLVEHAALDQRLRLTAREGGGDDSRAAAEAIIKRLAGALTTASEAEADHLLQDDRERALVNRLLADVLDRGAFALRGPQDRQASQTIYKVEFSTFGSRKWCRRDRRCGHAGSAFVTDDCTQLLKVTTRLS
jgi:hypothetical protein